MKKTLLLVTSFMIIITLFLFVPERSVGGVDIIALIQLISPLIYLIIIGITISKLIKKELSKAMGISIISTNCLLLLFFFYYFIPALMTI